MILMTEGITGVLFTFFGANLLSALGQNLPGNSWFREVTLNMSHCAAALVKAIFFCF